MRIYNRKDVILRALIEHRDFVSSDLLANLIGVTSRTIRNDIKQLHTELAEKGIELVSIPGRGYKLNNADHDRALVYYQQKKMESALVPVLPDDRQLHILGKLIFTAGPLTYESLAEELFVSRSTIENDLSELESWLSLYHLQIVRKPFYGVQLEGEESALRYAMVNVLLMQKGENLQYHPSLLEFVNQQTLEEIQSILLEVQNTHHLCLGDDDFNYLLSYMVVSVFRIHAQGGIQAEKLEKNQRFPERLVNIAADIARKLAAADITELSLAEINQLQRTLQRIHLYDMNDSQWFRAESAMDEELLELVKTKINEISLAHGYDFFNDTQLIYGLFFYFKSFLHHRRFVSGSDSDSMDDIKKEYPSALEFAISISDGLKKAFEIVLSEKELSQAALYFCAAIERIELERKIRPLRVVIICSSGIGASQLLAVKIRRYFPQLIVESVLPGYRLQEAIEMNPDFIISTIPVETAPLPNIMIGHVLNENDFFQIQKFMQRFHQPEEIGNHRFFTKLFQEELFFSHLSCTTREEVITLLCEPMVRRGYVEADFCSAVLAREEIFSTAIGNFVAIPHALSHQSSESQIAVGILKKPIRWGKDKVQLVFLLNLQYTSIDEINQLYEYFFDVIQSKNKIQKLLEANDFHQFIELIQEK